MTRHNSTMSQVPIAAREVSAPQPSSLPSEAREVARRDYPYPQRFAIYREGRWPTDEEFRVAELCDISSKGLALILKERPVADLLVVELGVGSNVSRVLVKIVQISNFDLAGIPAFRLGCEFISDRTTA